MDDMQALITRAHRNAIRDPCRRRAMSEVQPDLTTGKWRIVGAWSSLRRSHPKKRLERTCDPPRKRISLFLRRRRTAPQEKLPEPLVLSPVFHDESAPRSHSHLADDEEVAVGEMDHKASAAPRHGDAMELTPGIGDLQTADREGEGRSPSVEDIDLEADVDVVQVGVEVAHPDGSDDEIIGEICLEDFADVESEDFEFLENQSVDMSGLEAASVGRLSRLPSLKLDNQKLRWIGNEAEFAAFFAEVRLDDWFEVDGPVDMKLFQVSDEVFAEWEMVGVEHNKHSCNWQTIREQSQATDIRKLEPDFSDIVRRRVIREEWERRVALHSR